MKFKKVLLLVMFGLLLVLSGCNKKMVTVTFDSNGGSEVPSVQVETGKTIEAPMDPVKDDKEFIGWFLDNVLFDFNEAIKKDITLIAKWSGESNKEFAVIFRDWDDEVLKIEIVKHGESATAPEDPVREGFIFRGWNIEFDNVTSDLTVRPIYLRDPDAPVKYLVQFIDYNGKVLKEEYVLEGEDATPPADPSREGYYFNGWIGNTTNVQGNRFIRAQYIDLKQKFDIIYNLNGGSWGYSSKDEYVLAFLNDFYKFVGCSETIDEFIYGKSNTEFLGTWQNYIGGYVGKVNKLLADNDLTVDNDEFFFNSKAYKDKWANLGEWVKAQNHRFAGDDYYYGALDFYRYIVNDPAGYIDVYGDKFYSYPEVNEPTAEDFYYTFSYEDIELPKPLNKTFKGWYLDPFFNGEPITHIPAKSVRHFELYAKWDDTITYEVYFNTHNGTELAPITAKFNDLIYLPTGLVKDGYTFLGWYIGDKRLIDPFVFEYNRSITIDAKWSSNTYTLENLVYDGNPVKYRESSKIVQIPSNYVQPKEQLRAAWISSLVDDFKPSPIEATMKYNLLEVLDLMESYNMNCFIFHIRTMNNAFYKTKLAPIPEEYGTYETFEQWDYLTWLIDECHKRGMEFHAWLNPYRIKSYGYNINATPADVSKDYKDYPLNPAHDPENILMSYRSDGKSQGAILNPAKEAVQDYIVNVCLEVMQNYDIDAIHFDDYFYTEMSPAGKLLSQPDQGDYLDYIKAHPDCGFSSNNANDKGDWRRMNVDNFIYKLSTSMREFNKKNNKHVQLGISPTGIYKNGNGSVESGSNTAGQEHYKGYLFCDTKKWILNEWIDYILPQSYWAFTHRVAGYADVMDWWNKVVEGTKVNLYSGIGLYMADPERNYSWGRQPYEVTNQILYTTKLKNVKGVSFFCYKNIKRFGSDSSSVPYLGLNRLKNEYWINKVPTPMTMAGK